MKLELSIENLASLGALSAKIPDTTFIGTSRNTLLLFKDGFIYANGRVLKQPKDVLTHAKGNFAESIVFPITNTALNEIIRSYNVGSYLEMEQNADLEKQFALHRETLTA